MPSIRKRPPYDFLCQLIAETGTVQDSGAAGSLRKILNDDQIFELAERNQISSMIAHALQKESSLSGQSFSWKNIHRNMDERISAYLRELDFIASQFAENSIPLVALKNTGIARGLYPCPGCCPMGDMDVLVERRHFRRAHEILLGLGYRFEYRSPLEEAALDAAEASGGAEYWKILPTGEKLWFELQWRPVAGRWIRPDQEPRSEELLARSVPIPGTAVRLLAPEDNLLQVALHTAKHSYVRAPGFRLHLDVDRVVSRRSIDWELFIERVEKLQVRTPVYFSLLIPKELFDTPIPAWVLARLKPPAWKERLVVAWLNCTGLFNPHERKFSRTGYVVFTTLLYDDFAGLLRAIFPDRRWMRSRYGYRQGLLLPLDYLCRLLDLAFRRVSP